MDLPTPRRLMIAWAVLCVLTLATMSAGSLGGGLAGAAFILAAMVLKAREILAVYLNLRRAPAAWRALFGALVLLIAAIVLGGQGVVAAG